MTLQEIEAFLAVSECGSMTHAAERLFITQPTLSHRIKMLEEDLGIQLINRQKGNRKIELTNAGRMFVVQAQKWRHLWNETKISISVGINENFSISVVQSLTYSIIQPILETFTNRNLPLSLFFATHKSFDAYRHIENGDIDAALISTTFFSNRVIAIPIAKEKLVFVCSNNSHYGEIVSPRDLDLRKEIHLDWGADFTTWYTYWFALNGCPFITTDSILTVENYIDKPEMWSFVPYSVAEKLCNHGNVRICKLTDYPPDKTIFFASLNSPKQPYYNLLLEDIRTIFSSHNGINLI